MVDLFSVVILHLSCTIIISMLLSQLAELSLFRARTTMFKEQKFTFVDDLLTWGGFDAAVKEMTEKGGCSDR